MADLSGFDANQVEPTSNFDPIPAGKYVAVITDSEMKANKAGTGSLLAADLSGHRRRVRKPPAVGPTEPRPPERDCRADRSRGPFRNLSGGGSTRPARLGRVAQPAVGDSRAGQEADRHGRVGERD